MRVQTAKGTIIDILLESDLGDYRVSGERIRTSCPVHGGDRQKSLSIERATGWGRCFNASCNATVLIREFNPDVAERLLRRAPSTPSPSEPETDAGEPLQPRRSPATHPVAHWQQNECGALLQQNDLLCQALFRYDVADCWQAQAYLETRRIPLEIAHQEQVAYFPRELLATHFPDQPALARWSDRLLFPLTSPSGRGFAGRSLWHWQLHMDETIHKALLDEPGAPPRWLKTNPAGWFCAPPIDFGNRLIVVEGPFDRLALLAAGFSSQDVVALVGTALQPEWLPEQVRYLVLALDADQAGIDAMWRLVDLFSHDERQLYLCPPPDDQRGKDWSERWRRWGADALTDLRHTIDLIP